MDKCHLQREEIEGSEGVTDGIRSPASEVDTSGVIYLFLDIPVQDYPDNTTLLTSDKVKEDPTTEMLWIHYKYAYTPLNFHQAISTNYVLPKRLYDCPFPICTAFIYGKAIKCPYNTKTARYINEYKPVASVGNCVSICVLVSSNPGLIVQMYGFIMCQCFHYSCVFLDNHSDFAYVHLLKSQTGDEALETKKSFDLYA